LTTWQYYGSIIWQSIADKKGLCGCPDQDDGGRGIKAGGQFLPLLIVYGTAAINRITQDKGDFNHELTPPECK
jgi:hypothetical protein